MSENPPRFTTIETKWYCNICGKKGFDTREEIKAHVKAEHPEVPQSLQGSANDG